MLLKELFYLGLCKTKDGKECYFPFEYKGELKNGCINEDPPTGKLWCYTKSNSKSNKFKSKDWGICMDSCPINCNKTRYIGSIALF